MKLSLYTDGSYLPSMPKQVMGGMVLLDGEGYLVCGQRYVSFLKSQVDMRNAGGELLAAAGGILTAGVVMTQLEGTPKNDEGGSNVEGVLTLYHDYNGIAEFIAGTWRPKKAGTQMYVATVQQFVSKYPNIELKFKKVKAHTGNKWNEIVDAIANNIDPRECRGKMLPEYRQ